jgi:hypothetical protein
MPRPRSRTVTEIKAKLLVRLREGAYRPGQRFFSNRALERTFGISYQTAHRLIAELASEGMLERRPASGTYVAGPMARLTGVELLFHPRAKREESFGARLLKEFRVALQNEGIPARLRWAGEATKPDPACYPVVWECPKVVAWVANERRYLLLLNDRPTAGLAASLIDSVSTDDYSGGACAAELLRRRQPAGRWAVLAGPSNDARSRQRVAGFVAICPETRVVSAGSWFFEDAIRVASRVLPYNGVFCCNDRLAEAVVTAATVAHRPVPALVGFDDAPVSERMNFTTIAIPWDDIVRGAISVIRRRLAGDHGATAQLIFSPFAIVRGAQPT